MNAPEASTRRRDLDVLRAIAFFLVYLAHALPTRRGFVDAGLSAAIWRPLLALKTGGAYGVDVFFLLSAYLITELLLREVRRSSAIDVPAFWMRRILRIWPLYFAFLAFALLVAPQLVTQEPMPLFHAIAYATFWGNVADILWPDAFVSVAGILWSVSIEEQFYLTWPLVVRYGRRHLVRIAIALVLVSTVVRLYLVGVGVETDVSLWANTLTRLEPIAVGALIAVRLNGRVPRFRTSTRVVMIAAATAALVFSGATLARVGPPALLAFPLATAIAALLLFGFLGAPWPMPTALVTAGRVSYGLYVFHVFALTLVREQVTAGPSFVTWPLEFLGALVLTVLCALASYRWLEQPFLRLKDRAFTRAAAAPGLAV